MTKEVPPSVNRIPGLSDHQLEDDRKLALLRTAVKRLPLLPARQQKVDACALGLLIADSEVQVEKRLKGKNKVRSPVRLKSDMKQIKTRSGALLEYFTKVDRNLFELWVEAAASQHSQCSAEAIAQWHELRRLLAMAYETAEYAFGVAKETAELPALKRGNRRGRKKEVRADYVTTMAAYVFELLTGKTASREVDRVILKPAGAFHPFLVDIFKVLDVTSSPDEANRRLQARLNLEK